MGRDITNFSNPFLDNEAQHRPGAIKGQRKKLNFYGIQNLFFTFQFSLYKSSSLNPNQQQRQSEEEESGQQFDFGQMFPDQLGHDLIGQPVISADKDRQ